MVAEPSFDLLAAEYLDEVATKELEKADDLPQVPLAEHSRYVFLGVVRDQFADAFVFILLVVCLNLQNEQSEELHRLCLKQRREGPRDRDVVGQVNLPGYASSRTMLAGPESDP